LKNDIECGVGSAEQKSAGPAKGNRCESGALDAVVDRVRRFKRLILQAFLRRFTAVSDRYVGAREGSVTARPAPRNATLAYRSPTLRQT
jgi:hypothetical protein